MFSYDYPRPALTADVVVLRDGTPGPEVLLVQRREDPSAGLWALPGGFVNEYELPADAARRELAEETGVIAPEALLLVGVFGKKGRDPRGWTVSCAYLMRTARGLAIRPGDDAAEVRWFPLAGLPQLAFDHAQIISEAVAADTIA